MSTPIATYRMQFREGMTFVRAAAEVDYLKSIGITHLYASPIFAATTGSTHGYDVTDHNRLDPALGGETGFTHLSNTLRQHGLGLILDIVPNHMAASPENPWFASVLEWGEQSPYARHFDIDWAAGPLTLPFLGADFEACLGAGELKLAVDETGRLVFDYYDTPWPLAPASYPLAFDRLALDTAEAGRQAACASPGDEAALRTAVRDLARTPGFAKALAGIETDADLLRALHAAQPWRLDEWRSGRHRLTYRRFFEITGLIGVRVEDETVFEDVHRLVLDLVRSGAVDGLRIDHVDGLADPAAYLERLRRAVGPDVPILVEKILEPGERLPEAWPIEGTTGYEFIAALAAAMTDEDTQEAVDAAYAGALGGAPDDAERLRAAKTEILTVNLEGELSLLTAQACALARALGADDATDERLRAALVAAMCAFPVYRTYVDADGLGAADRDVLRSVEATMAASPDAQAIAGERTLLFRLLRLDVPPPLRDRTLAFVTRFQQTTGPVMAKALEDTLFFRSNRLIALNEVGGDPHRTPGGARAFHDAMAERVATEPQGLSATATHDTKRGEDARARLYTVSEAPDAWAASVARWRGMQADRVARLPDGPAPEPETEWLVYQALLGAWPFDAEGLDWLPALRERFLAFVEKAMREDKRRTRWTAIDETYEAAVKAYAAGLLDPDNRAFLDDFAATIAPYVAAGAVNSCAQTLLKIAAPGIPDIYNGAESWDLSFVDPDNRRPVDVAALAAMRARPVSWPPSALDWTSGAAKQRLVAAGLAARAARPDLFSAGSYEPLAVTGPRARHVLAFARRHAGAAALVIVPRLPLALIDNAAPVIAARTWGDTAIDTGAFAGRAFRDVLTGETVTLDAPVPVASALARAPVAFLVGD